MRIEYLLPCDEFSPPELLAHADTAERAGFTGVWLTEGCRSRLGAEPFTWSMAGALGQRLSVPVTAEIGLSTARLHPAGIAQAAATCAALHPGRIRLALNPGGPTADDPPYRQRLDRLTEALHIMRRMWRGEPVDHHGAHYTVEGTTLADPPPTPPPVWVTAAEPQAAALAARHADGLVTAAPDPALRDTFRELGDGPKPLIGSMTVCWAPDTAEAATIAAERRDGDEVLCGPDLSAHLTGLRRFRDQGYTAVHIDNVGPHQRELLHRYRAEVLPAL
ncbi:G6PDH family F420-dependent oxidoreductase [Stackebrandtia albiflava]|uniref:G6PDH family F420-dependent oxidoreductase n=1 Tax=Stackebrandtia albiflava TaxID=406432 RepID=A0A562V405_9ACTN|nr:LLM class flavin-dependent oxidoreductase [Stackebrandtia albiflava]TWJ12547.1 G6PDH family F420-dependent oxidoreductase [Stackebrandtia albiflava]